MADHVVVLRAGVIEQQGAPLDLYERPANQFVAGFIGSPAMNFLPGKVANGTLSIPALKEVPELTMKMPSDGTKVELGIRPEHLRIDPAGNGFRLDLIEKLGGISYAYLYAATGERLIVATDGESELTNDMDVGLSFDPARAYLFDMETGLRLR